MKKFYFSILLIFFSVTLTAQVPAEAVGNATTTESVSSYTGWTNQGVLTFSGNAEVQNNNPSSNTYSSGGSNIYFANTPGTYFEVSDLPYESHFPDGFSLRFNLYGYDEANLNELSLSMSNDGGLHWIPVNYSRVFSSLLPATPWDIFETTTITGGVDISKMIFRFTQTTSNKTFRLDDISWNYVYLTPIHSIDFSVIKNNDQNVLRWKTSLNTGTSTFFLEKSIDTKHFSVIDQQRSLTEEGQVYSYSDKCDKNAIVFYRLKIVTTNGKIYYSEIIKSMPFAANDQLLESVRQSGNILNIEINSPIAQTMIFTLTDAGGRSNIKQSDFLLKGVNTYQLNIEGVRSGSYYLTIANNENRQTKKIVILQ